MKQLERLTALLNIQIPMSLLEKANVRLLYRDGNEMNWTRDNVTYCFGDGPLESPFYPGFYYIPGFSRYVIDRGGEIILVKTAQRRKWWRAVKPKPSSRGGYFVLRLVRDDGKTVGMYRHRALALTFFSLHEHPCHVWVNHKNGVGGDDRLDNLEFCTPSENIQHAYRTGLFSNKVVNVETLNWKTGEVRTFDTIADCARSLGLPYETIHSRLSRGNRRRYPDGWRIKRSDEVWDVLNEASGPVDALTAVICREIYSGNAVVFSSISDAARHTGAKPGSIQRQCVLKPSAPLDGWNYRYLHDFESWPTYTEKHLQVFRARPKKAGAGIEVYDLETNEELFFVSPEAAAEHFKLSPITTSALARREGTYQKRFKFKLFRIDV